MPTQHIESFDGTPLFCRSDAPTGGHGDSPTVVFSHSIGCNHEMWDAQAAAFAPHYRVLRFDRRGHGRSGVPQGPYTLDILGRDALAVLDAHGVSRAHYVGLSQGGVEAMWLATRAPERIDHVVIANSTTHIPTPGMLQGSIDKALTEGMAGLAASYLARWLSAEFRAAQPERAAQLEQVFAAMSPQGFASCLAVLTQIDERENIKRITAPTLVLAGAAEAAPVIAGSQTIAQSIPGARFASIPAAAHLSGYENPQAFNAAVLEFLAR